MLLGEREAPLSFSQQLLQFFEQIRPGGGGAKFAVISNLLLEGEIDVDAVRWALEQVSLRHDILRTVVLKGDGTSLQRVATDQPAPFDVIDLGAGHPGGEAEAMASRLESMDAFSFDLMSPPFLRGFLGRLGERRHVLTLVVHHSVCDRWSIQVLERDLLAFYRVRREGIEPPPRLEWQYADYAWHQHRSISSHRLTQALEYWHRQLDGLPPTRFPVLSPVSRAASWDKQNVRFQWDERLSRRLLQFVRDEGMTLFSVLLTAYALLIADLTGEWDLAVPTLVADRGLRQTHDLAGFLVNVLLLRTGLRPSQTGWAGLTHVRNVCIGALEHYEVPFLHILNQIMDVGLLLAEESYAIMPLQVVQSRMPTGRQPLGPDCTWSRLAWQAGAADELTLPVDGLMSIWASDGQIAGSFSYGRALFAQKDAEAIALGLGEIAGRLVTDIRRPVGQLMQGLRG